MTTTFSTEPPAAPTPAPAEVPAATSNTPSAPSPSAQAAPGCVFVCNVAQKGRVAPDDETRFTSGLVEVTEALRQCRLGGKPPSYTLRFDSSGALTGFGVDHVPEEEGGDAACIEAVNQRRPAITYPGPATVRCTERCAR